MTTEPPTDHLRVTADTLHRDAIVIDALDVSVMTPEHLEPAA